METYGAGMAMSGDSVEKAAIESRYCEDGELAVSGDYLTVLHHAITGHTVTGARSLWG